ncbi:MAG: hypothetical protein R2796_01850 [Chitinophagaceae bacterium]|nr:hypothetical protein [Chitinophagaceae bacterium]MCB0740226.1 hypothetical protein [Chitinophagaceae bacterium]HQV05422.1 hypothetical protein [Chitinophagaceae bacterium]
MAILKFRIYFEEDESVYRDVVIKHTHSFLQLHEIILKSYEFDSKHQATFYRSNDQWKRGKQVTLAVYDEVEYKAPPLLMADTSIGSEIRDPNQRFVYLYDFNKGWTFHIELINVAKEENPKITYPSIARTEGIAPSQYGTKGLLGDKFADIEEKYDLSKVGNGFGEKDADGEDAISEEFDESDEDEE